MPRRGDTGGPGPFFNSTSRAWIAGIIATALATLLAASASSGLEWYNFGVVLKEWKPTVDSRLDLLEKGQNQKFDDILKELRRMNRENSSEKKEK